jgi:WD40 repeat protein
VRTFSGHTGYVIGAAFSPDGKYVLTGSYDFTAKLWEAATGVEVRTFDGHTDVVTSVAFSPDGKYVLMGSADKTAQIWDTDPNDTIRWACAHLTRDLTPEERTQHFIADNKPTCPAVEKAPAIPKVESNASKPTIPGQTTGSFIVEPTSASTVLPTQASMDVSISDPFDNNQYDWPVLQQWNDNGIILDMQVLGGELDWTIDCVYNNGCYYIWSPGGMPAVSDFNLYADVKRIPETTNGYGGVLFRYVDGTNYYMFACNDTDGTFSIWTVVGDSYTEVAGWMRNGSIHPGQFNRLGVEAVGSSFNFSINGTDVFSAEIKGIPEGKVGVGAGNYSPGKISLVYDNFDLTGVSSR